MTPRLHEPGASAPDFEEHRPALVGHCYRMLGSAAEADDAVQEAMMRAWRQLDRLQHEQALRSWLYRIATNVCLDLLAARKRRGRPMDNPAGSVDDPLTQRPAAEWLEPIADSAYLSTTTDPHERLALRQRTRLAFVAAMQQLPPKQRAALLMTEVLGCSAAEIAECLSMSVPAVHSALQRGRAKVAELHTEELPTLSGAEQELLERYVAAFERFDVDELTRLFREDVTYSMPPFELWLRGVETVRLWLSRWPGNGCKGSRLVSTAASGWPAFAQYRPDPQGGFTSWALIVLEISDGRIAGVNNFIDVQELFPRFGLPLHLDASGNAVQGAPREAR